MCFISSITCVPVSSSNLSWAAQLETDRNRNRSQHKTHRHFFTIANGIRCDQSCFVYRVSIFPFFLLNARTERRRSSRSISEFNKFAVVLFA